MAEVEMAAHGPKGEDGPHPPYPPHIDGAKMSTLDRIKEKIVHALPDSKSIDAGDLERLGWAHGLSVFYVLLYTTLLVYFVVSGTAGEMAKKFLSQKMPSSALATCESVPVAVTGTFFADNEGRWSSSKGYDNSFPLYQLDMTATNIRPDDYTKAMQQFAAQVQAVGARQANSDVISSLIAWGFFRAAPDTDANMQFRPLSDIALTLAGMILGFPVLSSKEGVCDTSAFVKPTFSTSDMLLSTPFPKNAAPTAAPTMQPTALRAPSPSPTKAAPTAAPNNEGFTQHPTDQPTASNDDDGAPTASYYEPCPDQIRIDDNNNLGIHHSSTHSFDIDMRSAMTAFALNMGIIDASALAVVNSRNITYGSLQNVEFVEYFSDSYPDMKAVYCSRMPGKPRACFATDIGDMTPMYPVITTTFLTDNDKPNRPCSCPQDALDYWCNIGVVMQLALVFSKTNQHQDTFAMGWKLQQMMADDLINGPGKVKALVGGLAYTASFVQTSLSSANKQAWKSKQLLRGKYSLPSYKSFAADFASLGKNMSIISYSLGFQGNTANINSQGVKLWSFATSKVNDTSVNGNDTTDKVMCQDTLFQSAVLQAMAATPPLSLVQPYFSCRATARSALVTAAGVAAGNASLISTVFLTLTLVLLVQYTNTCRKAHKVVPPARKALLDKQQDRAEKDALQAQIQLLQQQNAFMQQEMRAIALIQRQQCRPSHQQPHQQLGQYESPPDHQQLLEQLQQQQLYMQSHLLPSPAPYSAFHLPNPTPPRRPSQQRPSLAPAAPPLTAAAGFEESNPMHTSARYSHGSMGGARATP